METLEKTKTAVLKVVKIDETEHWNKRISKHMGRIYGVYIYDSTQETFCCELTPSYDLRFLGTFTEKFVSDELDEEIRNEDALNGNQDMYMHVRDVEKLKTEGEHTFEYTGKSGGYSYEEEFERVMEYESGNPTVC